MSAKRIAPDGGYDFKAKRIYRNTVWQTLRRYSHPGVSVLMPSSEGDEIRTASAQGFPHGQDFGFTHAHLKALRTTCDNAERWINARLFDPRDQEALNIARQARDIIAALLPPETP